MTGIEWLANHESAWNDRNRRKPLQRVPINSYVCPSLGNFRDMFKALEKIDERVSFVFMHPDTWLKIAVMLPEVNSMETINMSLEIIVQRPLNEKGIMAYLWGAAVVVGTKVPKNRIWFVGDERPQNASDSGSKYRTCSVMEIGVGNRVR